MQQLQIYVYGPKEEGFLDLPADASLDIESYANAFDENLTVGEFSLPVEMPWTARNRRLLGFAERLKNDNTQSYWRCVVYDTGLPVIENAKMTMLEKKGRFDYLQGSFNVSIAGTKGLYGSQVRNKYLKDLSLGGPIKYNTDSRSFAEAVMKGTINNYPYIAFAPVAIESFFDINRPDYSSEFLAKDTVNNIIAGGGSWTFGRPQSSSPGTAAASGTAEYMDYRTVPFFNLLFVVKKCFEEFGYTVKGHFITGTDFSDVYLFNNYAIEKYSNANTDVTSTIIPGNHMPTNTLITDFLKGIFSFWNIYMDFAGTEVTLYYRKDDFTGNDALSLNDVVASTFDSSFVNQFNTDNTSDAQAQQTGYSLNYTWDGNDQYYSDRVKDWLGDSTIAPEKNFVGTVAKFSDLGSFAIDRPLTTNDVVYCQADNLYYQVADATGFPILYDAYAEGLNAFKKLPASRSVECPISTLCTYVQQNSSTGLYERQDCLATRQAGSYFNNKGIQVLNPCGLRVMYIKNQVIGGVNRPVSFNWNRNAVNQKILPYSLTWTGNNGIAATFHERWQNLQDTLEVVKTSVTINQRVLNNLNSYKKYEIGGVIFFAYKTEFTIPLRQTMEIYLVPV